MFEDIEDQWFRETQHDIAVILCKVETIFPLAFFDIVVHLVMHLPEEAIRGGLILSNTFLAY